MLKIDSPTWKYRERGSIWMVTPYDSETFRTTSQSITSSMDEGLLNRSSGFFIRYYLNHWWLRVSMSLFIALCIDRLTCDTYVRFGNLNYFFVSSSWRGFQTARIDDLQKRGRNCCYATTLIGIPSGVHEREKLEFLTWNCCPLFWGGWTSVASTVNTWSSRMLFVTEMKLICIFQIPESIKY